VKTILLTLKQYDDILFTKISSIKLTVLWCSMVYFIMSAA